MKRSFLNFLISFFLIQAVVFSPFFVMAQDSAGDGSSAGDASADASADGSGGRDSQQNAAFLEANAEPQGFAPGTDPLVSQVVTNCAGVDNFISGGIGSLLGTASRTLTGAISGATGGVIGGATPGSGLGNANVNIGGFNIPVNLGALGGVVGSGLQSFGAGTADFLFNTVGTSLDFASGIGQGISDLGGAISGLGGVGEGLSGLAGGLGSLGGIAGGLVAGIMGGGGPVPTDPVTIKPQINAMKQKQTCADGLANVMAKQALARLNGSILNWINTGFEGNPLYITNTQDYLKKVSNNQFFVFANEVNRSESPWARGTLSSLVTQERVKNNNDFNSVNPNTIDQVTGSREETERLVSGDPSAFSWARWNALAEDNNLTYFQRASSELAKRQSEAQTNALRETAEGVRPVYECIEYDTPSEADEIAGTLPCKKYKIVTPATAVKEQLNVAVTSPQRQLELADQSGEERLLLMFGAMAAQILTQGIDALSEEGGVIANTSSYVGANRDTLITGMTVSLAGANLYLSNIDQAILAIRDLIPQLDATIACYAELNNENTRRTGVASQIPNPAQTDVDHRADYGAVEDVYERAAAVTEQNINQLSNLRSIAASTTDPDRISEISNTYTLMVIELPQESDTTALASQLSALTSKKTQLSNIATECQTQLGVLISASTTPTTNSPFGG